MTVHTILQAVCLFIIYTVLTVVLPLLMNLLTRKQTDVLIKISRKALYTHP